VTEPSFEDAQRELERIVDTMPVTWHGPVTKALRSLSAATGEIPDEDWWMGWANERPGDS